MGKIHYVELYDPNDPYYRLAKAVDNLEEIK